MIQKIFHLLAVYNKVLLMLSDRILSPCDDRTGANSLQVFFGGLFNEQNKQFKNHFKRTTASFRNIVCNMGYPLAL